MVSAKYNISGNVSDEVELANDEKTFVFKPGQTNNFDGGMANLDFEKVYNIIRIDIGAGDITFVEDGAILNPDYLDTNSIALIDSSFLSEPAYISRGTYQEIRESNYDWDASSIPAVDKECIVALCDVMGAEVVDMDGALLIPFEPKDFTEYKNISEYSVELIWDMEDAIYESGGEWYWTDRVMGTPFDFQVNIEVFE
jgi:hypothetical protein